MSDFEEQPHEDVTLANELGKFEPGEPKPKVDISTPTHLTEGFRSINPTTVGLSVGALIAVLGIGAVLMFHHGASTNAQAAPTSTIAPIAHFDIPGLPSTVGSAASTPGYATTGTYGAPSYHDPSGVPINVKGSSSGFPYGSANGGPSAPVTTGSSIGTPTAPPSGCPVGYSAVNVMAGQPPECIPSNGPVAGSVPGTGTPGSYAVAVAIATPLPSQLVDVGAPPSNPQEAQARNDIAARGGSTVAAPAPQPVYANGRFVGYVYPPAPIDATVAQQQPQATPAVNDQFASSAVPTTPDAAGTSAPTTQSASGGSSSPFGYAPIVGEDQLDAMTLIPLALISSINSDLPGTFIAQTTANVYDSRTHRRIVIPAGTLASGSYDARLVAGQTRILAMVNELRFADGREFYLGSQEATDALGASGMTGNVDTHGRQLLNSALLLTVLGATNAALTPQQNSSVLQAPTLGSQIQAAAAGQLANIGDRLVGTQIGRAPTIRLNPPYSFGVLVMRDLPLDRYEARPQVSRLVPVAVSQQRVTPRIMPRPVTVPIPTSTPVPSRFCCR